VIDRAHHNLSHPLLYQVATTVLWPAQIASTFRQLLKDQRNTTVLLGEVTGINKDAKFVYVSNEDYENYKDDPVEYDAGAVCIRNKFLSAFERAEGKDDPILRQDLTTIVLVGRDQPAWKLRHRLRLLFVRS
jgi:NADH dehydrogenase